MRKIFFILFGLFLLSISSVSAQATTFAITSIGTIDTSDGVLATYSYTSENPTINGTAEASAEVTITIDEELDTVTANSAGVWTYKPTTLLDGGTYDVTVETDTDSESFTISISESGVGGSTVVTTGDTDEAAPATLPDTGVAEYTLILTLIAVIGIAASSYVVVSK